MKHILKALLIVFIVISVSGCEDQFSSGCEEPPADVSPAQLKGVQHFVQSTIRIERDQIIYFDPYRFPEVLHDADVIFITHSHSDHFSKADLEKVKKEDTLLVVPESMTQRASTLGFDRIETVSPGSKKTINGIECEATFAYTPGNRVRHAKDNNWVGYIVTLDSTRYYVAGDTNFVPELTSVKADVAFLPVGGGSSMDAVEAAEAARSIAPQIAIPIHYGVTAGDVEDARHFVELLDEGIDGYIYSDDGELID